MVRLASIQHNGVTKFVAQLPSSPAGGNNDCNCIDLTSIASNACAKGVEQANELIASVCLHYDNNCFQAGVPTTCGETCRRSAMMRMQGVFMLRWHSSAATVVTRTRNNNPRTRMTLMKFRPFVAFGSIWLMLILQCQAQRIAILGGGRNEITGPFVAKYLMEYLPNDEMSCGTKSFESLTLFDAEFEIGSENVDTTTTTPASDSAEVLPGTFGNSRDRQISARLHPLVVGMAKNGDLLSLNQIHTATTRNHSIVFHNGNGTSALETTLPTLRSDFYWRYTMDYYVMSRLASQLQTQLNKAYRILLDYGMDAVVKSPADLWTQVGLDGLVRTPMDIMLKRYRITEELPFWRRYLPWIPQGSFLKEALSSILLLQYHQDVSQVNCLAGLMAFLTAMDGDGNTQHSLVGGVSALAQSAWQQTQELYARKCPHSTSPASSVILYQPISISTIVGSVGGFDLYNQDGQFVGTFDQVILAQPLAGSSSNNNTEFLIKSHVDEAAVLQPMPMGGLIHNADEGNAIIPEHHDGHDLLPRQLPSVATRPYIRTVTTVVEQAELQKHYWFGEIEAKNWKTPHQILFTAQGKKNEFNVTQILRLDYENSFEVTSSQPLATDTLKLFFGNDVQVVGETVRDVAPDYQGGGISTDFLLYDGATGFQGHTKAGALYYPLAMELTVSNLEMKAMGAKAVAKLIAQRLEWIKATPSSYAEDEL